MAHFINNCWPQWDPNSDLWSRMRASWPQPSPRRPFTHFYQQIVFHFMIAEEDGRSSDIFVGHLWGPHSGKKQSKCAKSFQSLFWLFWSSTYLVVNFTFQAINIVVDQDVDVDDEGRIKIEPNHTKLFCCPTYTCFAGSNLLSFLLPTNLYAYLFCYQNALMLMTALKWTLAPLFLNIKLCIFSGQ